MVQKLKGQQVKVVTKDGECNITLNINISVEDIKIALEGMVAGALNQKSSLPQAKDEEDQNEEFKWAIPDFEGGETINFGKEEE